MGDVFAFYLLKLYCACVGTKERCRKAVPGYDTYAFTVTAFWSVHISVCFVYAFAYAYGLILLLSGHRVQCGVLWTKGVREVCVDKGVRGCMCV